MIPNEPRGSQALVRFGTDGIRGQAGVTPITEEVGHALGRAAVRFAATFGGSRVLVAKDTRPSGPKLEAAIAAGIAGVGGDAMLAGIVPTSGLAAVLAAGLGDVGVMITASHNAFEDNGFKVLGPGGRKLGDAENELFESWLAHPEMPTAAGRVDGVHGRAMAAYSAALVAALPMREALRGRRVAMDLANGAGVTVRRWLLDEVPAEWVFVGVGGGRTNEGCGSEHPEALRKAVLEHGCEAGLALDGDGDRCRIVAADGDLVDGDALAWLLARASGAKSIAVTVMSTTALEDSLPGVRVVRTPVGDRHLLEALARGEAELGCEESGHVVFSDALPTGDGLVTGIRALAHAFSTAGAVRSAVREFVPFPRVVTKVVVRERPPLDSVPALEGARQDGERALGPRGRVFLRYSGTEPILRLLVEGPDRDVVARVSADITRVATETLA